MNSIKPNLDNLFVEKLGYEFVGEHLPVPEIEGSDNIIEISKEYSSSGINVITVYCKDRITEFQKKVIQSQKSHFPNSHFLFISNNGKVIDIYNLSTSKKLKQITYNQLEKNTSLFNEKIQFFSVDGSKDTLDLRTNIEKAFETSDRVTKKFFDKFKSIHKKLQKAITGIKDQKDIEWYASVLMNRLMFIYFLQKHKVIQNDPDFLLNKFDEVKMRSEDYYLDFLLPLFFYGFAKRDSNPFKAEFTKRFGPVRYLNGGLFYPHHIEKKYYTPVSGNNPLGEKYINTLIRVNNDILLEIMRFLNGYTWYLDNRPMKEDTDINPDMLGYIFEKYINQKELGAYYTKEDITGYITQNTIIPFILDKLRSNGFDAPDPAPIITANEDITGKMADYIEEISDYDTLKFLYKDVLMELTVLDPAVGSGAFLFSALNILLPVYQKTIFKLKAYRKKQDDVWLEKLCLLMEAHSEEYFLTKQIILNNLYGVDIVQEAAEICKLRLFLQLASHLPDITAIEPLPDIDFNIYSGNSLVGGLSWEDLQNNYTMDIFTSANRDNIKKNIDKLSGLKYEYKILNEEIGKLAALKEEYRNEQQQIHEDEDKLKRIKGDIELLEFNINDQIDVGIKDPFHWFIEFDLILKKGGFDVIIGNPPYVEYSKVKKDYEIFGYDSQPSGNLYAFFIERSIKVSNENSKIGLIVPISFSCTKRMQHVQKIIEAKSSNLWLSHFAERPSKLFEGAEVLLNIALIEKGKDFNLFVTGFNKWNSSEREFLFDSLNYIDTQKIREYVYPKFSSDIEKSIWKKINTNKYLGYQYSTNKIHKVYYRIGGGRYWKIFTDFQPHFTLNGKKQKSSRENYLYFNTSEDKDVVISALSSSLFYWYFLNTTNCRDLNPGDINFFPFSLSEIKPNFKKELIDLSYNLMKDYEKKSQLKNKVSKKTGNIVYQEFYPRYSKNIIDKIDELLGKHYNLTDSEITFIKNFDIKYRLGDLLDEPDN